MEQLIVGIVEARDLMVGDINGFSDPFVQISLLDAKGEVMPAGGVDQTSVIKKTLAPVWKERFVLGSSSFDLRLATTLRCLIYDFDGLKKDDLLGVVDIPLDVLADGKTLLDEAVRWALTAPRFSGTDASLSLSLARRLVQSQEGAGRDDQGAHG